MKGFLRDNGLSLVLIALFVLFFAGQAVFGWRNYNDEQDEHYRPQIGFVQDLATGAFGEAVFENWESEFLQMSLYVVLTAFLFQRGSSESKDPDKKEEVDENPASKAERSDVPLPVKKGLVLMLYNHSLSLAFIRSPSSIVPAFSHLRTRRFIRRSLMRGSTKRVVRREIGKEQR